MDAFEQKICSCHSLVITEDLTINYAHANKGHSLLVWARKFVILPNKANRHALKVIACITRYLLGRNKERWSKMATVFSAQWMKCHTVICLLHNITNQKNYHNSLQFMRLMSDNIWLSKDGSMYIGVQVCMCLYILIIHGYYIVSHAPNF